MAETRQRDADESVLNYLDSERVLTITRNDDGTFNVTEHCDDFFGVDLTADELRELAAELIALADKEHAHG